VRISLANLIPILNQSAIFVGNAARRMPWASSVSSTYVQQYTSSPPPCRLGIIFDLEMVLVAPNTQSSGRESGKQWMRFMGSGRKKIRGFGSFSVREYKAYKSRNPIGINMDTTLRGRMRL